MHVEKKPSQSKSQVSNEHRALEPMGLRPGILDERPPAHVKQKTPLMPFEEAKFLSDKGWERRGMHTSKRTDMWAHPEHSQRWVTSMVEREFRDERGYLIEKRMVEERKSAWVHFTREGALTREGDPRREVVAKF